MALEYIPAKLLQRSAVRPWFGFINIWEDRKCWQLHEVVFVPLEDLIDPWNWWTMFHEIAHILIDRNPKLASKKVEAIQTYLVDKHDPGDLLKYFVEVAAEIIGYELGFFGDYDLFLNCLWPYLIEIEATLSEYASMETYLFRTLLLEIWDECYGNGAKRNGTNNKNTIDYYNDDKILYDKFLRHIRRVKDLIRESLPKKEHFKIRWLVENQEIIVAKWLQDVREFLPFIKYLYTAIVELETIQGVKIRHQEGLIDDPISKSIAKKLIAGKIYWDQIEYPEAVVYHFLKNKYRIKTYEQYFRFRIATILTFWNAYSGFMGTRRHVSIERF